MMQLRHRSPVSAVCLRLDNHEIRYDQTVKGHLLLPAETHTGGCKSAFLSRQQAMMQL